MRNPHKALEAIEILTGGDLGLDLEFISTEKNLKKIKNPLTTLRRAARLITEIYIIAHAEVSNCKHHSWEEEKYKIIKEDAHSR